MNQQNVDDYNIVSSCGITNESNDLRQVRRRFTFGSQSRTKSIESGFGRVGAVYAQPAGTSPTDCLFIAHGVKGPMNSSLVSYFHSGLAARGFLAVKFNFPYTEGRWRLARKPDRTEVLVECYRRVVEETLKSEWKPKGLFLGGISMGAELHHM